MAEITTSDRFNAAVAIVEAAGNVVVPCRDAWKLFPIHDGPCAGTRRDGTTCRNNWGRMIKGELYCATHREQAWKGGTGG